MSDKKLSAEEFLTRIDSQDPIFDTAGLLDYEFTESQALNLAERYASHSIQAYKAELVEFLNYEIDHEDGSDIYCLWKNNSIWGLSFVESSVKAIAGLPDTLQRLERLERDYEALKTSDSIKGQNAQMWKDRAEKAEAELEALRTHDVVNRSEQFYCYSADDNKAKCETQCLGCAGLEEQAKQ